MRDSEWRTCHICGSDTFTKLASIYNICSVIYASYYGVLPTYIYIENYESSKKNEHFVDKYV